jgi:GT2 family glycosyltransferase
MITNQFISIITINFNQAAVTNQLLSSLAHLNWPFFEVIVVDNKSTDSDFNLIDHFYKNVSIIKSDKNRGFAGGNNLGIQQAKGEYILLLNNDTEVGPGFLEPMVRLFQHDSRIGAISPKIKYFYFPDKIQYAGFTKMNPVTLRMNAIGSHETDLGQYDQIKETNFAHGCAMMVSRKVIEKVGPMPEDYFLYYEEHDWSTKIKKAGFKIYYQPMSVVLHKESVSVQKNSILKTYYLNRNRILYMRLNFNLLFRIIATTYLLLVSVPKNTLSYLIKKEFSHLRAYREALIWNISHQDK